MSLLKRTYALPAIVLEQFEREVTVGKRSALIASLLREYLEAREREHLRQQVIEGCREMAEVYLDVEREYHALEEEVDRGLETQPLPRRHRARSSRPRRGV